MTDTKIKAESDTILFNLHMKRTISQFNLWQDVFPGPIVSSQPMPINQCLNHLSRGSRLISQDGKVIIEGETLHSGHRSFSISGVTPEEFRRLCESD